MLFVVPLAALPGAVLAQTEGYCPAPPLVPLDNTAQAADRATAPVEIRARFGSSEDALADLDGDVVLTRADQYLAAEQLQFDQVSGRGNARGSVVYRDASAQFSADTIDFDLRANRAELNQVSYQLVNPRAAEPGQAGSGRGEAASATLRRDQVDLRSVSFTTCPRGDAGWALQANQMQLDQASGRGTARGAKIRFKGVPFLYLPRASFPIDDRRQSGFLYPSLGSSNDNGLDFSLPYYWNIAPNQDATLAPRLISDRGVMLDAEYRYLTADYGGGQFDLQYLPDDDLTQDDRSYARLRHRGPLVGRWFADVDINDVSDVSFFEDFGDSLLGASPSFLRSRVGLSRRGSWWQAGLLLDDYEIVDADVREDQEPYTRLPRVTFGGQRWVGQQLWWETDLEAAAFRRDTGLEGNRIDLQTALSWPWYRPGYYLIPKLALRYTGYDLDRADDDSPDRLLPIASLQGGLSFERSLSAGRRQTLEPNFQLLYVPFEAQGQLPAFDTRELTFSYGQLFRSNRFSGADRQADARQLSLGLTTRIYDQRGASPLEASLGTIVYFDDQRVQLAGQAPTDASTSPLVGELRYRPSQRWQLSTTLQWDPEDNEVDQAVFDIRHRGQRGQLVNFAYRQRRDLLEQLDASVMWPVNQRWNLLGRWNYSLRDDTTFEALAGFEYESCCWALRLFGRQYLRNQQGDKRNGVLLELELKGLGSLGRKTEDLLQRAILGRTP